MKTLTKFVFAIAVGMFSLSCVTDATSDLEANLDGGQETKFSISLEESRTQLGKQEDGLFPIFWSEGDAISANGVASTALSATQAGNSVATFVVKGELSAPYCIAYPAAPAGQVLFAENQTHVDNTTFGSDVLTMYGYGDTANVKLNYLAGVLKIGVVGKATITKAQISTVGRAPIAGAFDFDFEKGVATATEDSKSVINYSFGEGIQLTSRPTYIHAVVPPGVYDELYITLFDTEGYAMFSIIKTDDNKPLAAGRVRTFSNAINYCPSNATIIKDKESLKAWAAESARSIDVAMVADVDMTGEEWTPVTDFTGIFRGNGYAIKGLSAPLFGDTGAILITGVHLEDVDIEATNVVNLGALTGHLTNTKAIVTHCSASGSIKLNYDGSIIDAPYVSGLLARVNTNQELKYLVSDVDIEVSGKYELCNIGGILGYGENSPLTNCTNLGSITFKGEATGALYVGGIARYAGLLTNCVNGSKDDTTGECGKIVIDGTSHGGSVAVAGLIEQSQAPQYSVNENNHNYGNIYYQSDASTAYVQLAGLLIYAGRDNIDWHNCTNHGNFVASGASDVSFLIGGLEARHFNRTVFNDCHNYGNITVTAEANAPEANLGGLIGCVDDTGETCYIESCSNHGNIKAHSNLITKNYLGGILGKIYCGQFLLGDSTKPEMQTHNYGEILYEANSSTAEVYAGGGIGLLSHNLTSGVTKATTAVRTAFFTNHGDITVNGLCKTANIGGLVGRVQTGDASGKSGSDYYYALFDSCNKGNMTVNATVNGSDCAIGGLFGFLINGFTSAGGNWVNEGKLTFTGEVKTHRLLVGGFIAATDKPFTGQGYQLYNFGDIECTGKINTSKNNRIGGLFGQINRTFSNFTVYCNIKAAGYSNIVGMLTGCARSKSVNGTNCAIGGSILYGSSSRPISLTKTNYTDHLYGTTVNWSGIENYDGCTFLSVKPTI